MYKICEIVDDKYQITEICSDKGGMGTIFHIEPFSPIVDFPLVLKCCKALEEEDRRRFRREVRLLKQFEGNSKVVQIIDSNLNADFPYFVMKYYPQGDVSNLKDSIKSNHELQEKLFLELIGCIEELHLQNIYHRDIKPENFLIDNNHIVVSDFGLLREQDSTTCITGSLNYWGTPAYMPPEFYDRGGFKRASVTSDIFMLGKTMYSLLTKRSPAYITNEGDISPPIFNIVQRCCNPDSKHRYQSLAELKQSIVAAYDVITGRGDSFTKTLVRLGVIKDRLAQSGEYRAKEVKDFFENLSVMDEGDQIDICRRFDANCFKIITDTPFVSLFPNFLSIYASYVESTSYMFEDAEIITKNMSIVFYSNDVSNNMKVAALDLAIRASEYKNRYAAMEICRKIIVNVIDVDLGKEVAAMLMKDTPDFYTPDFILSLEPSSCNSESISSALRYLRNKNNTN